MGRCFAADWRQSRAPTTLARQTKAYDIARCRDHLRQRGSIARIPRKRIERNDRLGRNRWVVERTHAWFARVHKLRIGFERRIDLHLALLLLAPSSADGCFLVFVSRSEYAVAERPVR